jgi:hypothetical protein
VAPAHEQPKADQHKVDPATPPYVIALTPEQHEARLRQAETLAAAKDAPPRPQIEMGGSGTVKVSFKDAVGGDVAVTSSEWSATGPVTVTPVEDDPTSAKVVPTGVGPATVTAIGQTETGSAQASTDLMVIEKIGAPVAGTIEVTVEPPAAPEAPVTRKPD